MSAEDRGDKGAVGWCEFGGQNGGGSPGFGPGDGNRLARGQGVEIAWAVQSPLSARNRASISEARRRAASACSGSGGGPGRGGTGGEGLGA